MVQREWVQCGEETTGGSFPRTFGPKHTQNLSKRCFTGADKGCSIGTSGYLWIKIPSQTNQLQHQLFVLGKRTNFNKMAHKQAKHVHSASACPRLKLPEPVALDAGHPGRPGRGWKNSSFAVCFPLVASCY